MEKCRETFFFFFWLLFCGGCYKCTETLFFGLFVFGCCFMGWGWGNVLYFKSTVKIKKLLVSKKGDIFLTQIQFSNSIDSCEISGDCFRWHLLYCESVSFSLRQFLQFYRYCPCCLIFNAVSRTPDQSYVWVCLSVWHADGVAFGQSGSTGSGASAAPSPGTPGADSLPTASTSRSIDVSKPCAVYSMCVPFTIFLYGVPTFVL